MNLQLTNFVFKKRQYIAITFDLLSSFYLLKFEPIIYIVLNFSIFKIPHLKVTRVVLFHFGPIIYTEYHHLLFEQFQASQTKAGFDVRKILLQNPFQV